MCQDTGTAIVMGKKGQHVLTGGPATTSDEEAISRGVYAAYTELNLRYSQMAPLTTWDEANTGTNLPAQIELYATGGDEYELLFMAKGGGSANKSLLFQETKALLTPAKLLAWLDEKLRTLGTAACPPYHLALVIGGTSAEFALKTAKYAVGPLPRHRCRPRARPPATASATSSSRPRCSPSRSASASAPSSAASTSATTSASSGSPATARRCPIAIAVSCSADRQALARITADGVFLEQLETDPAQFLPETTDDDLGGDVVRIDLARPMDEIRAELSRHPVKTRLSLTGPMVVARDIAHAKIAERLDAGEPMPAYLRDHCVYYAGPAKTPDGVRVGLLRPDDGGADGLLRRAVPGRRRVAT